MRGRAEAGDLWTWTAIDADAKLVPFWLIGSRDSEYAMAFMEDLAKRVAGSVDFAGRRYVNIHTAAHGLGEIRGQMLKGM